MNDAQTIPPVTIVSYQCRGMTAQREVSLEDLGLSTAQLPEGLRATVKTAVVPPEVFREIETARQKARRLLMERGVRVSAVGGYVLNPDDAKEAMDELAEIGDSVAEHRRGLVQDWAQLCEEKIDELRKQFPTFLHLDELCEAIRRAQPTTQRVQHTVGFQYWTYDCVPTSSAGLADQYDGLLQGLFGDLIESVAKEASETLATVWDAATVRRPTLDKFGKLVYKVGQLSYLDGRLSGLAAGMRQLWAQFPGEGHVKRADAGEFVTVLSVLANQDVLLERLESGAPLNVAPTSSETGEASATPFAPAPFGGGGAAAEPDETASLHEPLDPSALTAFGGSLASEDDNGGSAAGIQPAFLAR